MKRPCLHGMWITSLDWGLDLNSFLHNWRRTQRLLGRRAQTRMINTMCTCVCLQEGCTVLCGRYAHPRSGCPRTMWPGQGTQDHRSRELPPLGSCTGGAEPSPAPKPLLSVLRKADQWVRLLLPQQLSLTNARADMSEVKQGSNNIAANQRENWQSLAVRTAYQRETGHGPAQ